MTLSDRDQAESARHGMRLIVHMGLHKTGSTYLQHIMNDHHEAFLSEGVYYEKQSGYPAHHFAAWDILRGDTSPLERMLAEARAAGCHTTILSSEDLEGAIFDRNAASAIEAAALSAGVDAIEWHMCVRDVGEYFTSLYAQLQHHVYADAVSMLSEILQEGMIMILDPLRGQNGTPYWCFCFDHFRYISAFADQTEHPVFVHDFREADPFPGWRILEAAGVLDAVQELPGTSARNSRMSKQAVRDAYCAQILKLLPSQAQKERLLPFIREHVARSCDVVDDYGQAVRERFSSSTTAALDAFGYASGGSLDPAQRRECA